VARLAAGDRVEVIAGDYLGDRGRVVRLCYDRRSAPSGRWWGRRYLVAMMIMDGGAHLTLRVGMLKEVRDGDRMPGGGV
jgi:hypothetical protein